MNRALLFAILTATTALADDSPSWPDLTSLDRAVTKAASCAKAYDASGIRLMAASLAASAERVASAPAPDGTARPDDLTILQRDLATLATVLQDIAGLSDPEIIDIASGLDPLMKAIFDAVGIRRSPATTAPPRDTTPVPVPDLPVDAPTEEDADAPMT